VSTKTGIQSKKRQFAATIGLIAAISMRDAPFAIAETRLPAAQMPASAAVDDSELRSIVHGLQQHYDRTHSFFADFDQQILSSAGIRTDRHGVLYYRRPAQMRWEFSAPKDELIVSDGSTLYNYQPDLSQVIETPLAQALRSSPSAALLLGIGRLDRDFDLSIVKPQPPDGLVHVALNPKRGGERLELALDRTTFALASLKVTDPLGNQTRFTFLNTKDNPILDDALFSFKAPQGADIIQSPTLP
jgi:outer membrane lipoprotein carrier protein